MYDSDTTSRESNPDYSVSNTNCTSRLALQEVTKEHDEAIRKARQEGLRTAAAFARVMDTGRGNEAEIAQAIERAAEALNTPRR